MLSDNMICGHIFDFCAKGNTESIKSYVQMNITDWRTTYLKDKPTTLINNDFLDDLYAQTGEN